MPFEQWGALLTAAALILTAFAALVKAIADAVPAFRRRRDDKPAPQVGIPAAPAHDDIDYRAYAEAIERAKVAEEGRLRAEIDAATAKALLKVWIERAGYDPEELDADTELMDPPNP